MELSQVKAAVKSWEKAFKAANRRDPTKEDIKRDPSDIAEQYALYRKLSKSSSSSQSQSQSQPRSRHDKPHPSSSTSASTSTANAPTQAPRVTPRTVSASDFPTTPTPPSRRSSGNSLSRASLGASQAGPPRQVSGAVPGGSDVERPGQANGNEFGKSLKRSASRANLLSSPPPGVPPLNRSAAAVAPTARTLFLTPKKNAYSGPVLDPNPVNPFSIASPSRSIYLSRGSAGGEGLSTRMGSAERRGQGQESPFIHFTSPKKFKEVLEANSYHRRPADAGSSLGNASAGGSAAGVGMGITPRTRARKRLRGEPVEDTPVKDRPARRRGGIAMRKERTSDVKLPAMQAGLGFSDDDGDPDEDRDVRERDREEEEEDSEDGLGPTPVKGGRGFTNLFDSPVKGMVKTKVAAAAVTAEGKGKAEEPAKAGKGNGKGKMAVDDRQPGIMDFFGRASKQEEKGAGRGSTKPKLSPVLLPSLRDSPPASSAPVVAATPSPSLPTTHFPPASPGSDALSPPPPPRSPSPTVMAGPSPPKSQLRRNKVVALSEDEEDEWDPEGGKVVHRVVIVPTRRAVRRRRGSDSLSEGGYSRSGSETEDGMEEEDVLLENDTSANTFTNGNPTNGTTTNGNLTNGHTTNGHPQSPSLPLTLLTLQSPPPAPLSSRRTALESLRVRAIFNPLDAARLRAVKRGQDVRFSGEGGVAGGEGEEGEEEVLGRYEAGLAGGEGEGGGEGGGRVEGDDDWESEDDGWKRNDEHLGVEDDW